MTRLLLSVDTEADNQWEASGRENLQMRNIAELPRLQKLCDQYGVRPTYLITYEVATDEESRAILVELAATGRCEIGTHHHPWTTPPLVEDHLYPLNLSPSHFDSQLRNLTQVVSEVGATRPVSYRAGRNGFCGWQVELLEKQGYLVDSSVDPFFNQRTKGGPSFAGAPSSPYMVSGEDPCLAGTGKLLEIPISSALNRRWPSRLQKAYADFSPAYQFRRVLRLLKIVRPIWLRPSYSSTEDMLWLAERLTSSLAPTANIIFHSSELLPGGSPYYSTAGEVDGLYRSLEALFQLMAEKNVQGKTFHEFRDEWMNIKQP